MGSFSGYFIKSNEVERITKLLGQPDGVPGSAWFVARYKPSAGPPPDDVLFGRASLTQSLSQELGEMIFLYADSSGDSFAYEHARDGQVLRKLVWFPMLDDDWTPGWLCAEGQPEAWEAVLFRPDTLARALEDQPGREGEIRRLWQERSIVGGTTLPAGDASLALAVEQHFQLKRPAR